MQSLPIKKENLVIRKLKEEDLEKAKKFQIFINELIKEKAQILFKNKKSLKEEKKWLEDQIEKVEKNKKIHLVAEDKKKNKIIASTGITLKEERQNHIGEFGISIIKDYRNRGLGTLLTKKVIELAEKELNPPPKLIRLSVYSTNKPAIHIYKKVGFKEVAKIPKQIQHKRDLVDEVIMLLEL